MSDPHDELWESFIQPPDAARPRVWWHWMNGNVDEEGIRLDLQWMKRVGIGGAQSFEGGMNVPQLVAERVVFGSPQWQGAMRTAAETAEGLGLELTIATSAGWSAAGAPWVEPADAMKKLVWSEVIIGEGAVSLTLPDLPSVAGRYQDVPRWGSPPADPVFCRDIVTLAVPAESWVLVPRTATTAAGATAVPDLVDGAYARGITLPRDPTSVSSEWIAYRFDEPVTVAAVTVGLPGPRGFGSPPPVLATLEASADGQAWHPVTELPATQSPVRSRSFAPETATWFRLLLGGAPASSSVPPMDEGVLPLPFPPPVAGTVVTQFALWTGGRISAVEEKAGFSTTLDYYRLDDRGTGGSPEAGISPDGIIDLSDSVSDGVLDWVAPPGSWRIVRFGYSLTGHQNGPAPSEATGLEVDKLDAARVEAYLERWITQFRDAVGADLIGGRGIRSLLSDSIESGPQNWTEILPLEFERRRGYSLLPWLPVLAGYIVADAEQSDRVLWDFRQTIAGLYADSYYATVARVAHRWGLDYYAEALEDHRPQLGDDMQMRSHADVPMGAMWTFREADGPTPTYVADLRGAASVAHVYGKPFTGAESMSSFGRPYVWAPASLKPIADVELGLGVTRFCIHTSPHQPEQVRPPGIALTPHLGQTFTRNETWGELARPWIDYLARSSHLLNLGHPVADIAYFYGEEGPLTAVFGDSVPDDVPPGFAWDFVSADALMSAVNADVDGRIVSLGGARYRVLYLGGRSHRMTLRTLARIAELVAAGATVVGHPPVDSPSAADDPRAFAAAVAALWANPRVITGGLAEVLSEPDWIAPGLTVVHRALDGTDIYFVSNPSSAPMRTGASFRAVAAGAEWWDAVTGTRASARAAVVGARTTVDIDLPAYGSAFLVLREAREVLTLGPPESLAEVAVTSNQPDDPGFSGTAVWTGDVDVVAEWLEGSRLILRLEDVHDLAEVLINGQSAGVAWTEPFELDVTAHLTGGFNRVEIAVTNTWANRLIAEAADPGSATTQLTSAIYAPDAPLRPWGLRGPVTLLRRAAPMTTSAYT